MSMPLHKLFNSRTLLGISLTLCSLQASCNIGTDTPCQWPFSIEQSIRSTRLALDIPEHLSIYPKKRWLFAHDPYFRQGYYHLSNELQDLDTLTSFFNVYTFLILKPDAVASGAARKTIEVVQEYGFEPVHYEIIQFNRHTNRLFWLYHLNHAPLDRFALVDLFINNKDCALIILKDTQAHARQAPQFACQRLGAVKGHILTEKRQAHHIRARIGAGRGLLAFIHLPDEPIDIIRELTILFEPQQFNSIIKQVISGSDFCIDSLENALYKSSDPHNLSVQLALERIEHVCQNLVEDTLTGQSILDFCQQVKSGQKADWQSFLTTVQAAGITLDQWDVITVCAQAAADELPGIDSMYFE